MHLVDVSSLSGITSVLKKYNKVIKECNYLWIEEKY